MYETRQGGQNLETLDEESFDAALAAAKGLVLIDFWADWCGPCGVVRPILEALEPTYADQVDFYKVDADENRRLMDAFGIRSIPTVVLLKPDGEGGARVVGHVVGARGPGAFVEVIERGLNPKPGVLTRLGNLFGRK